MTKQENTWFVIARIRYADSRAIHFIKLDSPRILLMQNSGNDGEGEA
jgi:hypothetical protein